MSAVTEIFDQFDTIQPSATPAQLPTGGTTYLFEFEDDTKKDDWRADGYRWRQNGTKSLKGAAAVVKKIFFQV